MHSPPKDRRDAGGRAIHAGTGACGINCQACRLSVLGACTRCGAGTSRAGERKLATQRRILGAPCPILECAAARGVDYCLRDCDEFPCDRFELQEYPFGRRFLAMQSRRRAACAPGGEVAWPEAAGELWERLRRRAPAIVCNAACATADGSGVYEVRCLGEVYRVDPVAELVEGERRAGGEWDRQMPFLVLAYLAFAGPAPLSGEMVAPRELYRGIDAFTGHNAIDLRDLVRAFGSEPERFVAAARAVGGTPIDSPADMAYRFAPMPKIVVDYLLWVEDDEFPARALVLLDGATQGHYPADATAALVNLLTERIVLAASS